MGLGQGLPLEQQLIFLFEISSQLNGVNVSLSASNTALLRVTQGDENPTSKEWGCVKACRQNCF